MTITLLGKPQSTNNIYKHTCRGSFPSIYMTPGGRTLKEDYQWQARRQFHGELLGGRLEIDVTLYFDRKRRKDWDNLHKLSMDALSEILWDYDGLIDDAHVHMRYDKENPRIEITVKELEEH